MTMDLTNEIRRSKDRKKSPDKKKLIAPLPKAVVTPELKEKSRVTKEEWKEYTKTVWHIANTGHPVHPAVFPVEIPNRLIKLFSFCGENVLDPFSGTGTTARAALQLDRNSISIEQNEAYAAIVKKDLQKVRAESSNDRYAEVIVGDSRHMPLGDNSVQLVVTSPPYWNKADYGNGKANLGKISQYQIFLEGIEPVFRECFRVLEPGRKCCVVTANVNQHTNHGLLTFPLATDFAVMLRKIGFVMVNEIIWSKDKTGGKWGSANGQRPIFGSYPFPPNFLFKNVHEYVLIFAKPPKKNITGPSVMPYDWLMGTD